MYQYSFLSMAKSYSNIWIHVTFCVSIHLLMGIFKIYLLIMLLQLSHFPPFTHVDGHFKKVDVRGRKGERERNINLSFHLVVHSLVDSCMCPDRG